MRKTGLLGIVCVLLFFVSAGPAWGFPDVSPDSWAYSPLRILESRGVVRGYPDGTFRPGDPVSRAEALTLLAPAAGLGETAAELAGAGGVFRDLGAGHWAGGAIHAAWEQHLVRGYPDGTVRPRGTITRAEFAVLLVRALGMPEAPAGTVMFRDAGDLPSWARREIGQAGSLGLIAGYPDNTFRPDDPVTRAEAASMLVAFLSVRGTCFDFAGEFLRRDGDRAVFWQDGRQVTFRLSARLQAELGAGGRFPDGPLLGVLNPAGELGYWEAADPAWVPEKGPVLLPCFPAGIPAAPPAVPVPDRPEPLSWAYTEEEARRSAAILIEAMEAADRGSGRGEILALIDTGVDPGLDVLRQLPGGGEKLLAFIDLTEEGRVRPAGTVLKEGRYAEVDGVRYDLAGVQTQGGRLFYGYLEEETIGVDINGNGLRTDRFLVLFADTRIAGHYDALYIDTRSTRRFLDEQKIEPYPVSGESYRVDWPLGTGSFSFVLADLSPDGSSATLGFDANGHGTMMAAAAAGAGRYPGVAPASRLVVIKAFDRHGEASWETVEAAIHAAVENGATVISMSLGYPDGHTAGTNALTYLAAEYHRRYGILFVGAAGNRGPGLGSDTTPANGAHVTGVAAYLPRELANRFLGTRLAGDVLWGTGSAGPRADGGAGVDTAAPGMAVLPVPSWDHRQFGLAEGSSVSAALTAGLLACLLGETPSADRATWEAAIAGVIREGSVPRIGWSMHEAGAGTISYARLRSARPAPEDFRLEALDPRQEPGAGLYARDHLAGEAAVRVLYPGDQTVLGTWVAEESWVQPPAGPVLLVPGAERTLSLPFALPGEPGLYETRLLLQVPSTGESAGIPVTAVVPHRPGADGTLSAGTDLAPGERARFFVAVGPGSSSLDLGIRADGGSLECWVFDPRGRPAFGTRLVAGQEETFTVAEPAAGTWEIVVTGALENSLREDPSATARIRAGVPEGAPAEQTGYYVGSITGPLDGTPRWISLAVRDAMKQPVPGLFVEIDGRMRPVRDGFVTFWAGSDAVERIRREGLTVRIWGDG